jgi:hypothetical protein
MRKKKAPVPCWRGGNHAAPDDRLFPHRCAGQVVLYQVGVVHECHSSSREKDVQPYDRRIRHWVHVTGLGRVLRVVTLTDSNKRYLTGDLKSRHSAKNFRRQLKIYLEII